MFNLAGADTFNMLVPMNCPLYDEYTEVRASVALSPSELNSISTTGQSCGEFGIHARLPILKELYDSQDAAFLSNIGSLAEPLSKDTWEIGTGQRSLAKVTVTCGLGSSETEHELHYFA